MARFPIRAAACALLLGAAAPAIAAEPPDPMAAFYGNTLRIYVPAGYYSAQRYIDPDGTWREGNGVKGVWKVENGQVCNWQVEPAIVEPQHYCYPITAHRVGEIWTTTDPATGNEVIQMIEAGRREAGRN